MNKQQLRQAVIYFIITLLIGLGILVPLTDPSSTPTPSSDYALTQTISQAKQPIRVTQYRVVDGDTYELQLAGQREPIKVRALLIDTPELHPQVEPYAKAAKKRVEQLLDHAQTIQIEYEGAKTDRYGRHLAHIWVDDRLLQEQLVSEGLAIPRYIHYLPNSRYASAVRQAGQYAKAHHIGVWKDGKADYLNKAELESSKH